MPLIATPRGASFLRPARASADPGDRRRAEGAVWGLCLLLCVLLASALAPRWRPPEGTASWHASSEADLDCAWPREVEAAGGFTWRVACEPPAGGGRPVRGPARWLFGLRVELVGANQALLESLPGIGPARARSIVEARRTRRWTAVDDLALVHGIGPRTVHRLRPLLRVDPPSSPEASRAAVDGSR